MADDQHISVNVVQHNGNGEFSHAEFIIDRATGATVRMGDADCGLGDIDTLLAAIAQIPHTPDDTEED